MLNAQNVKLLISAGSSAQFPKIPLPHVVMSGRSNVGKSSLVNCLLNRKNFARISATPGKTATINFYEWDEKLLLADLPGYGYASVPKEEKKKWAHLVEAYLQSEARMALIVQLVDIRHKPTADDRLMMEWILRSAIPYGVVCTKCDKLSKRAAAEQVLLIKEELNLPEDAFVLPMSSQTGEGRDGLFSRIEESIGL